MAKRPRLLGFAALAGGLLAGTALEELVYRRVLRGPDPEADEHIGSVPGTTTWVDAPDGTKLYTRVYGPSDAKDAIVFAHGVVENHVIWHYVLRDLRADGRYKLVAYDARGHGESGPVRGPDGTTRFDCDVLGEDLAAVLEQTTTGRAVIVGHSLGGMTALTHLIVDEAERARVAGAVIVNSIHTAELAGWRGTGRRMLERLAARLVKAAGEDAKRLDALRIGITDLAVIVARTLFGRNASRRHVAVALRMFETTSSQTLAAMVDLMSFDVSNDIARIDVPVLIVAGSDDLLTPVYLSREMAEVIPDAELVVFDGCGHMAPFERHDDLSAEIRKFADRVLR